MSIAQIAVSKSTITWFATAVIMLGGIAAYFGLGQLEDPEFTVKEATVITVYPGASAAEVEQEVTELLEQAIQQMPEVKETGSISRAGLSFINVSIQSSYGGDQLQQVWDVLRKKVRDAATGLPVGVYPPTVGDDFGDVYGFLLAVYADGYEMSELEDYVDDLERELKLVEGVARVEPWGVQQRCLYIEMSEARLNELGLTVDDLIRSLDQQNLVVNAGSLESGNERMRVDLTGAFTSTEDIGNLVVRRGGSGEDELLRVRDVATVTRGYTDPPSAVMRFNGWPAIGLAISNKPGVNIVDVGKGIDARLHELMADLPVGIEVERVSWQSDLVDRSIQSFMVSLMQAIVIVLVVLWVAMGLRVAAVVGLTGLVFTIVGTFMIMNFWGIDLQRMSLGALVVAMGMMVDNAIVVADGIMVRLQKGMDRVKAAVEAATQPSWPLLGATVVAVMAFYPIYASEEDAGEYCASLFQVIAASLLLSWVLSVTIAPLMCLALLPSPKPGEEQADPYAGKLYVAFAAILRLAIRVKWAVVIGMFALLVGVLSLFGRVDQMFFPTSDRAQFMIDYWMPEGTQVDAVSGELAKLEDYLMDQEGVDAVSTFVGQGPPRFYLPVSPEKPYASYGQIIVNTPDHLAVTALLEEVEAWSLEHAPNAIVIPRRYGLGPSETWTVQAKFIGPGNADPTVLRRLAAEAEAIIRDTQQAKVVRNDWRQRVKKVTVAYDQERGLWSNIDRDAIADATRRAFDGLTVGTFRELDKRIPIVLRSIEADRGLAASQIGAVQVSQPDTAATLPLAQVTDEISVDWEDPLIWRSDRRRAITVQVVPMGSASTLHSMIKADIEAIDLPPGYKFEWEGEYKSSKEAQASLVPGVIPAVAIMALIVVGLFNAFRQPLIIAAIVPFALIGVVVGLLATGQPFGFVALLGAMSLSGMMIKNAIVLLDQIQIEMAEGATRYQAVIQSALSRFRPVLLAAGTTILGVVPLLTDVFWVSMAVVIMFGLAIGSALIMVGVPVFYACMFKLTVEEDPPPAKPEPVAEGGDA